MDPQEEPSTSSRRGTGRARGGQAQAQAQGGTVRGEASEVSPEDDSPPEGSTTARQRAQQERRRKNAQERARTAQMKEVAPSRPLAPRLLEFRGITSIPYASGDLKDPLKDMASEVLRSPSVLSTESARQMEAEGEPFLAFQLKKAENVSLYEKPTHSAPKGFKCSCRSWSEHGICQHVYVSASLPEQYPS
jgi:hypothetical protein